MPNPNPKIENLTRKGMGRIPTKPQKVAKLFRINPETIKAIEQEAQRIGKNGKPAHFGDTLDKIVADWVKLKRIVQTFKDK